MYTTFCKHGSVNFVPKRDGCLWTSHTLKCIPEAWQIAFLKWDGSLSCTPTPQPRTHTARLVAGPTDVSVKWGIVPRGNYSREDFTWVVPRVIHRTILHYKNLESLKGTFYTTALYVQHLSVEDCIAALIWGNFTPLGYYTVIEKFTHVKTCQ